MPRNILTREALRFYKSADLHAEAGVLPRGVELGLGAAQSIDGRGWIEVILPDGGRGYVVEVSARKHTTLGKADVRAYQTEWRLPASPSSAIDAEVWKRLVSLAEMHRHWFSFTGGKASNAYEWSGTFDPREFQESGLNLEGADLWGFMFFGPTAPTPLGRANFRRAVLVKTSWLSSWIAEADFTHADLTGCVMHQVRAAGSRFVGADLSDATLGFRSYGDDAAIDLSGARLHWTTIVLSGPCPFKMSGADVFQLRLEIVDVPDKKDRAEIQSIFLDCLDQRQRENLIGLGRGSANCR